MLGVLVYLCSKIYLQTFLTASGSCRPQITYEGKLRHQTYIVMLAHMGNSKGHAAWNHTWSTRRLQRNTGRHELQAEFWTPTMARPVLVPKNTQPIHESCEQTKQTWTI